jgi:hypothetical protein
MASLDRLARELQQAAGSWTTSEALALTTVTGTTVVFSAGYLFWAIRGGSLLSSLLCAIPAWRMLDPIPVLEFAERNRRRGKPDRQGASDDGQGAETLFG